MSTLPTRATLLAQLLAGNEAAGLEFGRTYRALIEGYAARLARGADIEEITTRVINQFVRNPRPYDPTPGRFRDRLMAAVRTRWLDLYRERRRDRHVPFSEWVGGVPDDIPDITEDDCERAERIRAVINGVRADFSPQTWEAFEQRQAGLPSAKVAENLGMTPNAVDGANDRVKRRLREEFNRLGIVPDGFA
jgi:RNA polymerase sigma factor (sigma-70 family)